MVRLLRRNLDRRGAAEPNPPTLLKTVEDRGEVIVAGRQVRQFEHSRSLFEATPETEYRFYDYPRYSAP